MKQFIVSAIAALLLAACAGQTPYQPLGPSGGVEATQIDERTLRVRGEGNEFTRATITNDHVLLKAAEETQRLGYDLFLVLDKQNTVKETKHFTPGETISTTTDSANADDTADPDEASGTTTTITTETPGEITYTYEPRTTMMVKMVKGEMPENPPPNLYSAASIIRFLGEKYYKK